MSANTKKNKTIPLLDVCFYFDGVERDRLDAGSLSRKSGEVLALRDRLLRLPDAEFASAIKTLRSLVDDAPLADKGAEAKQRAQSRTLYDDVRPSSRPGSGATTKVSPT